MIEKVKRHRQIWIIAGIVLLIVTVVLVIALSNPKGNGEQKANKDTISKEKEEEPEVSAPEEENPYESETGLEVAEPEQKASEREVPFVAPNGGQETPENQGPQGTGGGMRQEEKPALDDTKDDGIKGQYGEFF